MDPVPDTDPGARQAAGPPTTGDRGYRGLQASTVGDTAPRFLSGRVKPKEGRDPFKLDIDVLLQTGGKMGDVLAHLIDMAADDVVPARPTASADLPDNWWSNQAAVKAIGIEGWRSLVSRRPAGPWQVRKLGPPPGSSGCLVPPEIVQEFRLIEHYTSGGSAR
jgi:hypothetical protein